MEINKRGQFYLIAAVVIVGVIIGMASFTNYLVKSKDVRIYDLNKELKLESESVVNYGIIPNHNLDTTLENFTEQYGAYVGADYNVYFVYGNKQGIKALKYELVPSGSINIAGVTLPMTRGEVTEVTEAQLGSGQVNVKLSDNKDYNFNLKEGENFFFIIQEPVNIQPEGAGVGDTEVSGLNPQDETKK